LTQPKRNKMKKFRLTFSLRDWKQGSHLLSRLGLSELLSDSHNLELDDFQQHELLNELEGLSLEFELEELED